MKTWKWMLAGWVLAAVLGNGWAGAQAATTTVQDTVTDASGHAAAGSVVVNWGAFTTTAGTSVPAGSLATTLGSGGVLSVALLPNSGATPMGSYYTAVYHLSDGTVSREFWVVPVTAGGTVTLAGIRNQVLPTSVAMQTVSKQYVDTTVAKAMAGVTPGGDVPYVLTSGGTLTGPLTLSADPATATQAADKHYVDTAVAGALASEGAGGDLSGSYPNPSVAAVHATTGTLDDVTIGATTPAAGAFTTETVDQAIPRFGAHTGSFGTAAAPFSNTYMDNEHFVNLYGGNGFFVDGSGTITTNSSDTANNFVGTGAGPNYHENLYTPASSSAACSAGDFADDANFHYVCVAASTWKRVALGSF